MFLYFTVVLIKKCNRQNETYLIRMRILSTLRSPAFESRPQADRSEHNLEQTARKIPPGQCVPGPGFDPALRGDG